MFTFLLVCLLFLFHSKPNTTEINEHHFTDADDEVNGSLLKIKFLFLCDQI